MHLLFLSAQVGCTQAQSLTVQEKIGFLPQGFSNLTFSSLLPLFLFQCTRSSEALAVLKHFTVFCFVGNTWVLWLWVIKGFLPSPSASPGKFDGCDRYQWALLGKPRPCSAFSLSHDSFRFGYGLVLILPRPAGGSEAPGPRGSGGGGPRRPTPPGSRGPGQRTGWGVHVAAEF